MDLLFLAHRAPFPPDRGDRIRSWTVLRHLAGRARVHLVALADTPAEVAVAPELAAVCASVTVVARPQSRGAALARALARRQPFSIAAFDAPAAHRAVADVLARHPIGAIYAFSGQMSAYVPDDAPPLLMDFVDLDSAKFAALAEGAAPGMRWLLRREARLLAGMERAVAARAAASLFVTAPEAALFAAGGGEGRVIVCGNGIDTAHFSPAGFAAADEPLIVFTGQMDYAPNRQAVEWFALAVLPLIRASAPRARFAIVGRAPGRAVRALAMPGAVEVTGAVADVRPWLAAAAVVVAPLALARGVQNKVLEAMAMGRPVVASTAAAEGIDHGGTIRVADGADDVAAAVNGLLADRIAAEALGQAARARAVARFGWDAALAPIDALLDEIGGIRAAA